jgi:hypothetical protein
MFTRRTLICAVVCALLTSSFSVASASASQRTQTAAPQAQYYASYGKTGAVSASRFAAEAQGRYYASYGEPEALPVAQSPEPSNHTPWLSIALWVAAALAVMAAGAGLVGRLRLRRRATRVAA